MQRKPHPILTRLRHLFALAMIGAAVNASGPSAAIADGARIGATTSSGGGSDPKGAPVPSQLKATKLAMIVLNKDTVKLAIDAAGLTLQGGAVDLAIRVSADSMNVSGSGVGVSLGRRGSGIISSNGRQVEILKDGPHASIEGLGLRIAIDGMAFLIRDQSGLEVRIDHGKIAASDPSRLTLLGSGPA